MSVYDAGKYRTEDKLRIQGWYRN